MRLSLHADFSLRVLMYLAKIQKGKRVTTPALAEFFKVSQNHLHKVVQTLRSLGLVETAHGNSGGIRLIRDLAEIRIGTLLRQIESIGQLVDCGRGPCPLCGACTLKGILDAAENSFYDYLDRFTLESTMKSPTVERLDKLMAAVT